MDFNDVTDTITPNVASLLLTVGGTGALQVPSGSTAQQPAGAAAGAIRWNTTLPRIEYYTGSVWSGFGAGTVTSVDVSGGTTGLTTSGGPVTGSGTITLSGTLAVANGGTGQTTAAAAFNALDPMTTVGDIIYEAAGPTAARLAIGTSGQVLTVASGLPSWSTVGAASYSTTVGPSGTIAWSLVSGNTYNAVITHNLGTQNVVVQAADISNNVVVVADVITINSASQVTIQVVGNTKTLRVVIVANGASIAAGASTPSSVIVQNNGVALSGTYTTLNMIGGLTATGAAGVATINNLYPANTIVATGTTQGTAATLTTAGYYTVSTVPAGAGVIIGPGIPSGSLVTIDNYGANSLLLYPPVGGNFDAGTTNAPVSIAVGASPITVEVVSTTQANTVVPTFVAGTGVTITNAPGSVTISAGATTIRTLSYFATSLDSPNNSDWTINALAPTTSDPTNGGINVRQFSSTTEQGVGLFVPIPSNATNISFTYKGRAQTAPGTASTLQMKLYTRAIQQATPAAVPAWSAGTALTQVTVPTNAFFQTYTYTATLASLSLVTGNLYQFELTRMVSGVTGNWLMVQLDVSFT